MEPVYILKTTEKIQEVQNPKRAMARHWIGGAAAVLLLASMVIGRQLLGTATMAVQIALFAVFVIGAVQGKKIAVSHPLELHFFEDRLEVRRFRVPGKKGLWDETHVFAFADSPGITHGSKTRYVAIRGKARTEYVSAEGKPARTQKGFELCGFVPEDGALDIVSEIETHSPLIVRVQEN